jgi:hypothetical protein
MKSAVAFRRTPAAWHKVKAEFGTLRLFLEMVTFGIGVVFVPRCINLGWRFPPEKILKWILLASNGARHRYTIANLFLLCQRQFCNALLQALKESFSIERPVAHASIACSST